MANDCTVKYCTGFCSPWNELVTEEGFRSPGSKYSCMYFLLYGCYRTGNLRCKSKERISICLWNDWVWYRSSSLCGNQNNRQCDWCRWPSRYLIYSGSIYGFLCNLYGDCLYCSICIDRYCWKETSSDRRHRDRYENK